MHCRRETMEMGVPPDNRPAVLRDWFRGVPRWYVAGADTRGRREEWPYYSRSLRSAQSRTASGIYDKRVPSFVVAAGDSSNIRVKILSTGCGGEWLLVGGREKELHLFSQ